MNKDRSTNETALPRFRTGTRRCLPVALAILFLVAVPAAAQVGWLFGGEIRGGAAWFSPRPDAPGISMDNEGAFTADYTQHFGRYLALNVNYLYTNLSVTSQAPTWWAPYSVSERFPMQSLTVSLQVHFATGKVDPYIGAGLNVMYAQTDAGKIIYIPGGYLTPASGWGSGYTGPAFQAGITFNPAGVFVFNVEARYVDNGIEMDRYTAGAPVQGGWYYYRTGSYKLQVDPFTVGVSVGVRW
jgi:outer membrane protein W